MTKKALRQHLLQSRTQLPPLDWQQRNQGIVKRLFAQSCFDDHQRVLAYFSIRQEPDLSALWEEIYPAVQFGFPRCLDDRLVWHHWRPGESLVSGAFGILEPAAASPQLQATEVDWILVPCVGCDRQGYRIGYGGGFYDRLLANPYWRRIPTIGVTFDLGIVEDSMPEAWDQPLDYICTEKEWIVSNQ